MSDGGSLKRGGIYLASFSTGVDPQGPREKKRPVLVVQNDWGNAYADTTIVVPLSSGVPSRSYPFHVELPAEILGRPGIVMCEQIWTLSRSRIEDRSVGDCPPWLMEKVDEALRHSLGLSAEMGGQYGPQ
jgi:mRNA interferase MazF